jgi:hypothetical protein
MDEYAHSWSKEWKTHDSEKTSRQEQRESSHGRQRDVWDELAEVDRVRQSKNAEKVINYLESRLSDLTTVKSEGEEETSDYNHDVFAARHREVVKKGAGKQE